MDLCIWRFGHRTLANEVNFAVKGLKRTKQFAEELTEMQAGSLRTIDLRPLPPAPIRHVDGGSAYDGVTIEAFSTVTIAIVPQISPDVAIETRHSSVTISIPQVLLPGLSGMIFDAAQPQQSDENWTSALIANQEAEIVEGRLRFWTWDVDGLLVGE